MLTILPLASPLNPPAQVAAAVARCAERLQERRIAHCFTTSDGEAFDALLVVTGGTESPALAAIERLSGPAILLAHSELNSLPAALEILARLRQEGRAGLIVAADSGDGGLLQRVARHLEVRRRMRAVRLGRIGAPSDWLVASAPAPETVRATWGPEIVDVPISEVFDALHAADSAAASRVAETFASGAATIVEPTPADIAAAARVAVALGDVVRRHRLDACTVRCFDIVTGARTSGCVALSWLQDEGVVAGCEGDVPTTLTLLWLRLLTGSAGFMANPQEIDPAAGTAWLAHCTIARGLVERYTLRSHFESSLGVGIAGELAPGPATVARVGGADLRALFASDGEIVAHGDRPERCRTQVRLRLAADLRDLLARPLGNHVALVPGRWADELRAYHELFVAS